jgi:hypothetical protein
MAKVGRNDPCPCGSGRKAKHCCGVARGPAERELARAFLATEARAAALSLAGAAESELEELWDELLDAPALDLSLHFPFPKLVPPEVARLVEAIEDGDEDEEDEALENVLDRLDSTVVRAALATALLTLRDAGRIAPRVAAVAFVDLDSRSRAFVRSSLLQAAAVQAGVAQTPGGLVVAHHLAA